MKRRKEAQLRRLVDRSAASAVMEAKSEEDRWFQRLLSHRKRKTVAGSKAHFGSITALAFPSSSCWEAAAKRDWSSLLVSADDEGRVSIWKVLLSRLLDENAAIKPTFMAALHRDSITELAFVESNDQMATCSHDQLFKLWDLSVLSSSSSSSASSNGGSNGGLVRQFEGHESYVTSCDVEKIYSGGKLMASGCLDNTLRLWHTDCKQHVFLFRLHSAPHSVRFLPGDIHLLLTASRNGIHIWDVRMHSSYLQFIEQSEDLSSCFTTDRQTLGSDSQQSLSPSPNNSPFAPYSLPSTNGGYGRRSLLSTLDRLAIPLGQQYSKDTPLISFEEMNTSTKTIYANKFDGYIRPFTRHTGNVYSATPTSNGQQIVSCANDGTMKLWNVDTQKGVRTFATKGLNGAARPCLSRSDRYLLGAGTDGSVFFWQTYARQTAEQNNYMGHIHKLHSVSISAVCLNAENTIMATGDDSGLVKLSCCTPTTEDVGDPSNASNHDG